MFILYGLKKKKRNVRLPRVGHRLIAERSAFAVYMRGLTISFDWCCCTFQCPCRSMRTHIRYYHYYYTCSVGTNIRSRQKKTRRAQCVWIYEPDDLWKSNNMRHKNQKLHGDGARVYHFIRKQSGFVVHTAAGTG
jgi:hypothetical protein